MLSVEMYLTLNKASCTLYLSFNHQNYSEYVKPILVQFAADGGTHSFLNAFLSSKCDVEGFHCMRHAKELHFKFLKTYILSMYFEEILCRHLYKKLL